MRRSKQEIRILQDARKVLLKNLEGKIQEENQIREDIVKIENVLHQEGAPVSSE